MSPVAAPADRRFRRAHVKPGRKAHRWVSRAKPLLGCALAALAVVYGGYRVSRVVAHAHILQIDQITVRGNERLSQDDVRAALDGLVGESLIRTDLNQWRQRLLSSLWVRDAALRRSFPSTVEVVVWERRPIGIGRVNGDMYLVDDRGAVIDRYGPQYADLDLPIIDGLAPSKESGGPQVDQARADLASRVIAALNAKPDVARRLSQIDVSDPRSAAVILAGDPAVVELGDDQFLARLQRYLELASGLRTRVPEIDHVDARFENRMYVRPAGKLEKSTGRDSSTRR